MKRYTPLLYVALFVLCWIGLLGKLYEKGKLPGALIYAKIPEETIRFLDNLSHGLDLLIKFDPNTRPKDWQDGGNYGEDPETGLKKLEDANFIIYFNNNQKALDQAKQLLNFANDAISPLYELMGKYPYPADVNNRKLPIYMAEDEKQYAKIISILLKTEEREHSTLGVYVSSYSQMGCLTLGIVLNHRIWNNQYSARDVLWHEMNHYVYFTLLRYDQVVRPYMWVYEGLAEYFSNQKNFTLTTSQIEKCRQFNLTATFPDYIANYWGGESVYRYMDNKYGTGKVKNFIQYSYSHVAESSITTTFQTTVPQFETDWKGWLDTVR